MTVDPCLLPTMIITNMLMQKKEKENFVSFDIDLHSKRVRIIWLLLGFVGRELCDESCFSFSYTAETITLKILNKNK